MSRPSATETREFYEAVALVACWRLTIADLPRALREPHHRDERTGVTKEFVAIGDYVDLVARRSTRRTR